MGESSNENETNKRRLPENVDFVAKKDQFSSSSEFIQIC